MLIKMAFYCSVSFYFCMGSLYYFSKYLHWFTFKTIIGPFHAISALFLCLGGLLCFLRVSHWYKTTGSIWLLGNMLPRPVNPSKGLWKDKRIDCFYCIRMVCFWA